MSRYEHQRGSRYEDRRDEKKNIGPFGKEHCNSFSAFHYAEDVRHCQSQVAKVHFLCSHGDDSLEETIQGSSNMLGEILPRCMKAARKSSLDLERI